MSNFKKYAKRTLAGILTAALILTSGAIPNSMISVQAATVYNDTATALSELAGSTGLKIYRLTSDDAGKELTSGIYYVDEDLTFTGADSTSSGQAGGNGLKIADGATVYIYISEGKTLTATGGKGYAGTDGANGTEAKVTIGNATGDVGVTFPSYTNYENGKGGAGGSGATGGGAAIYVSNGSKIAILGNGSLNATGGTGGNAGNGQNGEKTKYYYISYGAYKGYNPSSSSLYATTNNIDITLSSSSFSGSATSSTVATNDWIVIGGVGGSGGGGAAGGGAGIGTNGADGNVGAAGVTGSIDYGDNDDDDGSVDKVVGNSATTNKTANLSGQVYIGNVTVNATGGAGGQAGSQQAVVNKHQHSITYYRSHKVDGTAYISTNSGTYWVQDGQSGGGGGAGGTGANIGTGGTGGAGGAGGDSGSCYAKHRYANETGYAPESVRGANGNAGTSGTGSSSKLGDTQYPYNNITFTNLTSANTKYYITKSSTFTAPDYSVSENQIFVGWKVTTPAAALPEAFGETADEQLTTANKIIPAGTEVSTAGIYGNITLEPYAVSHTHSWNYETDSTDSSKVYAWCTADENSEYCPYHGEEKKLTLSLNAEGKTYDGNAYNGATVENKITSVTKATAGSVTYYEADSDGNKTGSSISVPVNAGRYVAEVTVSDGSKSASATKAFEIKRADQTANVSMSGYEYGKTVSTPVVSGAKENPDVTYYYSTKNENKDGTEWKDIENDTLEPGTYYMYAVLAQTDNYNTYTTAPVSFTVQGSDMSGVTASDVTKTYDGNSYGITVNTGSIPNATVTYGTEAGTYDLEDCPAYKNVGTYTIYYKVNARGYNSFTGSATVTITKKAVTATVTANNKTYDGTTDATVSAVVDSKDLVSGDSITINGITGTFADKNAGTDKKVTVDSSKAEFTGTGVENYDITIASEVNASIEKLTAEFTWKNTELTYNGTEQAPTAELNGILDADKESCNVTVTGGKTDSNAKTGIESYTATASIDNANYELKNTTVAFTIAQKSIKDAVINLTPGDVLHTGAEVTQTVDVTLDNITLNDSDEYEITGEQTAKDFGIYTITVNGIGNYKDSVSKNWRIKDENPPTGEISIAENKWADFLNSITFGNFFKETQKVTINASDEGSGVDKVYYYNSNKALQEDAVKALADDKWTQIENGGSYNIAPENDYVVYAKITDRSGNVTYISSDGFVIDKTAPEITGVEDNGTYCEDVTFTVTDANLGTVTVDGKEVTLNADGSYTIEADNKAHTITAEDKAKNSTDIHVTVYNGHEWKEPEYTWSSDNMLCTAEMTCKHDASHKETETVDAVRDITTAADCENEGEATYTATFTKSMFTEQKKTAPLPALGHKYANPVFKWSDDLSSATALFTCERDASHTKTEDCTVTKEPSTATCTEAGKVVYTASVTLDGQTYTDTKEESAPATGHKYGEPVFKWSADYSSAEAVFTCENDASHVEKIQSTVKKEVTEQATGTKKGEITYTATVTIDGKTYQDKKTQETVIAGSEEVGNGKVTTEIIVSDDMPKTEIKNLTVETAKELLTADEKTKVEAGAEVTIYLEAKSLEESAVSTDDKKNVESQLDTVAEKLVQSAGLTSKKEVATGVQYIDLSLYKRIGADGTAEKIRTTGDNELEVTVDIPDNLKSDNSKRTYYVVRVHETEAGTSEVDILPTTKSGDTLTFKTDRFSTYALTYAEPNGVVVPTKVTLDKTQATLTSKGSTLKLTATVEPDNATNKKVTWKSSDTNVATVDENGLVTAVGNGTATITVTTEEGGLTATVKVTVNIYSGGISGGNSGGSPSTPVQKPASVKIDKTNETLTSKGSTTKLTATVEPDNAANKKVTWKSSDTNVATVDENGLVTAVGNGTATITATTEEGGLTASVTVTVNISSGDNSGTTPEPTKTPEIKPTEAPVTPTAEPTKEPEATVEPTTEPTVKPTEKPSVEDQSGLSGSEVSKLKLPILLAKGKGGDKKILISWASYKGADGYDCYWSYCNGKQNFRKFTGVKASKYRVTHKNLKNNREYKYFVAAYKMVDGKKVYLAKSNQLHVAMKNAKKTNAKSVTVNKTSVTLKAGQTFVIKSSTKLENAKKKQLLHADAYRYYTSNKEVAYVSKNGRVKAVKKGKCVIYILANNGVYRKIKIVVK